MNIFPKRYVRSFPWTKIKHLNLRNVENVKNKMFQHFWIFFFNFHFLKKIHFSSWFKMTLHSVMSEFFMWHTFLILHSCNCFCRWVWNQILFTLFLSFLGRQLKSDEKSNQPEIKLYTDEWMKIPEYNSTLSILWLN